MKLNNLLFDLYFLKPIEKATIIITICIRPNIIDEYIFLI